MALKQGSDHHYRGAIVLWLSRPFLMRAPLGGGAGRHRNRKVGGLRYAGGQWAMTIKPPSAEPKADLLVNRSGQRATLRRIKGVISALKRLISLFKTFLFRHFFKFLKIMRKEGEDFRHQTRS